MVLCYIWFSVPSVLWHCWLGHLTRKNPSPYDLYCVGGTLSLTQSTNQSSCYQLLSEHFGEHHVILLQMVAKWWCIKLCAIFSGPLCRSPFYVIMYRSWKCKKKWSGFSAHLVQSLYIYYHYNTSAVEYFCLNLEYLQWSSAHSWSSQPIWEDWQFCEKATQTWIWIGK